MTKVKFTQTFAVIISISISVIILTIVIYCLIYQNYIDKVFNAILPLIATWMGTIIAFYYGRDNFIAAQNATNEIYSSFVSKSMKLLTVEHIMIDIDTMIYYILGSKEDKEKNLSEFLSVFHEKGRLPVLTEKRIPKYILRYKEIKNEIFNQKENLNSNDEKTKIDSLEVYLNKYNKEQNLLGYNQPKGFVTIGKNASLKEGLQKLNSIENCENIFVTEDGTEKNALIGWVSNKMLLKFIHSES